MKASKSVGLAYLYLDLTEARVRDEGKPRLTHDEVKKRYGLK
jgi:hypothetical protein